MNLGDIYMSGTDLYVIIPQFEVKTLYSHFPKNIYRLNCKTFEMLTFRMHTFQIMKLIFDL